MADLLKAYSRYGRLMATLTDSGPLSLRRFTVVLVD
jgi:hypothetical protein